MVKPDRKPAAAARPVGARPRNLLVGFIGKPDITDYEAASLTYIGKCIAQLRHRLILVPAKGAADALRVGVEAMGGEVRTVTAGVLDVADRILLYPDSRLTERLEQAYPDIRERENVVFIGEDQLDEWVDAMKTILDERGIPRP